MELITRLEFLLMADEGGTLPPFIGHLFRAAFLNLIKSQDEELSKKLHEVSSVRSYSIGALSSKDQLRRRRSGAIVVKEGTTFSMPINFFDSETVNTLMNIFFSDKMLRIKLSGISFMFVNMKISRVTFQELVENAKHVIRFGFSFVTPCQFKLRNVDFPIVFPEPRLLFSKLANLWNKHSPEAKVDEDDLYSFVSDKVYARDYDLVTREIGLGKKIPFVGCTGQCGYAVKEPENPYALWLDILGEFGQYSNVGAKRTAGLGVVNYSRLKILQKRNNDA